ncbi:thioredoxin family protein [Algoriphagus halophilus]|uniref:Thioredoxin n=1 Tax=Algoriphagus halophilus TaxID=226505 RepID=A0A1N6DC91_9BACT|nr:thioredoxin family protein [Algoriphagus halophilus]SIN68438.1 Thioredoxin [Algoriphagus halophilus]
MLNPTTPIISEEIVLSGLTYEEYRQLIDELLAEGKTTGTNHSEANINYTKMNVARMRRVDKTAKISSDMESLIKGIQEPQTWLVLTEAWCGDASQSIPYFAKLAALNPLINLKLVLRDENPELMDQYLTNGARSIPKLIGLSQDLNEELFTWGPRPQYLQERLIAYKKDPQGLSSKEFSEGTYLWYARDRNQAIEQELKEAIAQYVTL